ncbi:MAG: CRISPR-associated endoribonuclease Cas6 [Nitrospirae bacterium]|nr:CRISPR-associated endoribonuclease Cas6 [Nitrospirota bacterium]
MRIRVNCKTEKLPIVYRHLFMSLIIQALNASDRLLKEEFYPHSGGGDGERHTKVVKPFTFSVGLPRRSRVVKERFCVAGDVEVEDTVFYFDPGEYVSLYVSSCDYQFIASLYNGLLEKRSFEVGSGISLEVHRVYMLSERKITGDCVVFKAHSPVSIEGKDGKRLLPIDENGVGKDGEALRVFNDEFNAIHGRLFRELRGDGESRGVGLYRPLVFRPLAVRKKVVKHAIKDAVERFVHKKKEVPLMYLTVFEGTFEVSGDERDLLLLYQAGVGLRTGQGFGMVEVER